MKLENQVCSLELAKKLKELGVKRDSFFQWEVSFGTGKLVYKNLCNCRHFETQNLKQYYPAYTVAELGEMLPRGFASFQLTNNKWTCNQNDTKPTDIAVDTEANARAKMLIWLIENKYIEAEKERE